METAISILDLLKWPLAILLIVLIFRKSISNLINRTKSIKGGKYGLEAESGRKQSEVRHTPGDPKSKTEEIEKGLSLLSDDTRQMFQEAIIEETELDRIDNESDKIQALLKYAEALYIKLALDGVYNLIVGSQIDLLNRLNSSVDETTDSVKFFYEESVKIHPEFKEYPYEEYLGFLENQSLIIIGRDNSVQITAFGVDFLKYMVDEGLTDLK